MKETGEVVNGWSTVQRPPSTLFSSSRGITQPLLSCINAWLKETSFWKCRDYFTCPCTSVLLNCRLRIPRSINYKKTCDCLTKQIKLWYGGVYFIPTAACFLYVAEGFDFLKRGAAHPPSFPMFHSAPPPPLPELKMDFVKNRCPPTSQGNYTPLYFFALPTSIKNWKLFLQFLFFGPQISRARWRCTSAFSSVVLDLKLANGCSAYITCQTSPSVTTSKTLFGGFVHIFFFFLQSEDLRLLMGWWYSWLSCCARILLTGRIKWINGCHSSSLLNASRANTSFTSVFAGTLELGMPLSTTITNSPERE